MHPSQVARPLASCRAASGPRGLPWPVDPVRNEPLWHQNSKSHAVQAGTQTRENKATSVRAGRQALKCRMGSWRNRARIDAQYPDWIKRLVRVVDLYLFDAGDNISPPYHSAKHRVLAIQPRRGHRCDEELRSVGVRPRICHAERVRAVVAELSRIDLVLEVAAPHGLPPSPIPFRIAGLHHEALDHAVEDHVFIVAPRRECGEVFDGARCFVREQRQDDIAKRSVKRCLAGKNTGDTLHCSARESTGATAPSLGLFVENIAPPT
mmetsp:Transcript_20517/g.65484  ORF Transcript_20517/g.65484 Transcript_20517/m.65484 type:complete len:265 (-) Transcript_20517:1395-2189(-)